MRKVLSCVAVVFVAVIGLTLTGDADEAEAGGNMPVLMLEKTVGTNPAECATQSSISVSPGTLVWYCYTLTYVSGPVPLVFQTVFDDQLGFILNDEPLTLDPGESAFFDLNPPAGLEVTESVTNTATWTASDNNGRDFGPVEASATVTVVRPTPTPTVEPTPTPTTEPTPTPTVEPTPTPSADPTPTPTATVSPTVTPDPTPTATATVAPTAVPTPSPTPGGGLAFTGSSSGTLAIIGVTVGLLGVGLLIAGWRLRRQR